MYGIIYCTVNKINGKKYIGQHKCLDENDNYLGSGKTLKAAIKKYGVENFQRYTLYVAETEEELDQMEIKFIKAFNATHRDDYYNINEGGNANRMCGENNPMYGRKGPLAPNYGKKYTEEKKAVMRDRMLGEKNPMYGKHLSEETRNKISEKGKGINHWNYGKTWSETTKKKMSEAKKGKPSKLKGIKKSKETCEKISKSKQGKKLNVSEEQKKKMAERAIERNHTEKFKKQVSEANKRYHENGGRRGAKPVVCIEKNIIYASCYDASKAIGLGLKAVSNCINGWNKTAGGFHWRLATAEESAGELVVA